MNPVPGWVALAAELQPSCPTRRQGSDARMTFVRCQKPLLFRGRPSMMTYIAYLADWQPQRLRRLLSSS